MSRYKLGFTDLIVEIVILITCVAVIWSGASYIFNNY